MTHILKGFTPLNGCKLSVDGFDAVSFFSNSNRRSDKSNLKVSIFLAQAPSHQHGPELAFSATRNICVLDEQKNIIKNHGEKLDHDILSEMNVISRCIKEALRLHPPLIMLLRSSHCDFTVTTKEGKDYDIPKGHIVATSPAFANRLPHVFKDPDTYDPDRFTPGREQDKTAGAFSYISFGGGRHGCLGEPFAYLQIKAIWSHLLRNFELELVSPFPETDWNAVVVGVKGEVMVRYKQKVLQ